ncbi:MAG: hypothetical protein KBC84_09465 [Proteobacteria bacterium]|nr:hypothetical protein [Pseudomonadota bacterium]
MTVVLEAQSVAIKESYMQTIEAYRSRVVILSLAFMVMGILFAIVSAIHANFTIQR